MRFSVLAIGLALALTACGPKQENTPAAPAASTQPPTVVLNYSLEELRATNGGSLEVRPDGASLTTSPNPGAFSATLSLGDGAKQPGRMVRVRLRVAQGAFNVTSFYWNFDPSHQGATQVVPAGTETTVDLPVDQRGSPVLIIGNGSNSGASRGAILGVQLLASGS